MINLSSVVHSSRMAQEFTVERRIGQWMNGEFIQEEPQTISMTGIITVASAKDLTEVPEGSRVSAGIKVLTTEKIYLTGAEDDLISDVIVWHEERYRVRSVAPDNDWGFYRSIATLLREG